MTTKTSKKTASAKPRRKATTKPKDASAPDAQPEPATDADAGDQQPAEPEPKPARKKRGRAKQRKGAAPKPAYNPAISMTWAGESEPSWSGTLDALVRMNELADERAFVETMRAALAEHGEFRGGGDGSEYVLAVVQDAQELPSDEPAPDAATEPSKPARAKGSRSKRPDAEDETEPEQPAKSKPRSKAKAAPEPAGDEPTKPARRSSRKRAEPPAGSTPAPETTPQPSKAPASKGERGSAQERGSARKRRGKGSQPEAAVTLAALAERYLAALVEEQRSDATVGAYRSDLGIAQRVFGEDTPIASLTPDAVRDFNDSPEVTIARSGMPKALPTIMRSRRVLRLALDHAVEQGWLAANPADLEPTAIDS